MAIYSFWRGILIAGEYIVRAWIVPAALKSGVVEVPTRAPGVVRHTGDTIRPGRSVIVNWRLCPEEVGEGQVLHVVCAAQTLTSVRVSFV